jgi:hypothetical protein
MNRASIQIRSISMAALLIWYVGSSSIANAYSFGYTVGDMRLAANQSGGTACPQPTRWNSSLAGGINRQWSTSLSDSPVSIFTFDQTSGGRLTELESDIAQSFSVWTGISGSTVAPGSMATLSRTSTTTACSSADGLNNICFNQNDAAFTSGVLAFTRVTSADSIGAQPVPNHPPSTFVGEIVDADILLRPADASFTFATAEALPQHPESYDLESVLTHELGHFFGFAHSDVWRAMMFPFVPSPGTFNGSRPTLQAMDAPLSDDDRTGMRVLYPDPSEVVHVGSIRGRILPANPLSLVGQPGVTGIFAAEVVAVDNATGAVIAATQAGWSCSGVGPPVFDGSYSLDRLPVGATQSYQIYVEPFTGPEDSSDVASSLSHLCRNAFTDTGWPAQFSCAVPSVTTNFSVRIRPPG